jgi:predicted DNA-binding protein YlxM (UPF0122 family)
MASTIVDYPSFLESYTFFYQHIEELYGHFSNVEKGREFARLVRDTLSSSDLCFGLEPKLNEKESHDEGVDIFWHDPETNKQILFCQSKFKIQGKDEFDSVISKFESYYKKQINPPSTIEQLQLFKDVDLAKNPNPEKKETFLIVTLWKLEKIIENYRNSARPSLEFFNKLLKDDSLKIIDGEKFYKYFLDSYQKEYSIPQEVRFKCGQRLISYNNVYVGIIDSRDLIDIYIKNGNGIFFENVRDFIGLGNRESFLDINNEIFKTASEEPSKMIERNNGITFKAGSLEYSDGTVILKNAGIINGCQTTLCIVKASPSSECFVPIKVVVTSDEQNSSDIARTTNTQNRIDKINLELSDFIRPQLIKISLVEYGISLMDEDSATTAPQIAASISTQKIFKSDLRYLFIGLFSTTPRNIFNSDYGQIRFDDLKDEFPTFDDKKKLNALLAKILVSANNTFDILREQYPSVSTSDLVTSEEKVGKIFGRFYTDKKGYKSYLMILAIYTLIGISEEKEVKKQKIRDIIDDTENLLDDQEEKFKKALGKIFRSVAVAVLQHFSSDSKDLDTEISQNLYKYIKNTRLENYYTIYSLL